MDTAPTNEARTNAVPNDSLAVPAMVLSLVGILVNLAAPIGLIMGIVSLTRINNSAGNRGGKGFALTAIIVGGIVTLLTIVFLFWLVWALTNSPDYSWYSST